MKVCTVCGVVTSRPGSRCLVHARQSNRSRHNALYSTRLWQRLSARVLRAWRGQHGNWCPGYQRDAHPASDLTVDHLAESRYLDGHPALFPDGLREWEAQVAATERVAVMADRLAELDGAVPMELDMSDAVAALVPAFLDDLVEPAKVIALEKLGAGDRAIRIATRWVRATFSSSLVNAVASPVPETRAR